MFPVEKMHPKLRVYFLLIAGSGLVFLVLYKTLTTEEQESESHAKFSLKKDSISEKKLYSPKISSLININALLTVTQSAAHLERQRLKEAEVHANIRRNSHGKESSLKHLTDDQDNFSEKDDIDHPGISLNERVSKGFRKSKPEEIFPIDKKFVHLDLKGAPPIIGFYRNFFPLLQTLGANGLLIEYEDMFPFDGPLESLAAHNAYKKSDLAEILQLAKSHNLEIMPLIQTFGHMEFVLKLKTYQDLREVPGYPQVICPTNNASQLLIKQIIDQVVSMHPGIKWLHIGSDEVYYIGECNLCQQKMRKFYMGKEDLFISHVKNIAKYVKEKYGIQALMWDDMFRMVSEETIKNSEIWKYVDLVAWQYGPSVEMKISPDTWKKYGKYFSGVWAASAFKGATGPSQYLTNISYHLENHISWLQVLYKYQHEVPFKGFVITGWQRYDHFAVLCELLPVAIPSLAVNLLFLQNQQVGETLLQKVRDILLCDSRLTLSTNYSVDETLCNFPGSDIFKGAQRLAHLKYMLDKMFSNSHFLGWLNEYNMQMLFSSPAHVELGTQNLEALSTNATLLYTFIQNTMPGVYDKYTIDEWLQTFLNPIMLQIDKVRKAANTLLRFHYWPRRPLSPGSDKNPLQQLF